VTITALQSTREEVQIIPPCFWKKPSYYARIYDPLAEIDDDSPTTIVCSHEQGGKFSGSHPTKEHTVCGEVTYRP